jgi:hypothetical protein
LPSALHSAAYLDCGGRCWRAGVLIGTRLDLDPETKGAVAAARSMPPKTFDAPKKAGFLRQAVDAFGIMVALRWSRLK